jgi:SAM-dependent methyltransferase
MVGVSGDQGCGAADLTSGLRAGYAAAAGWWAAGPERVYAPLAAALVGASAAPVAGARVLDLGAGTGVAGRAALAAGARHVVAADVAAPMLRLCAPPLRPVAASATALPFRSGSFDLVVAAFVLSHLPNLAAGLAEVRRVGLGLAASAFMSGWTHPAKAAIDAVLSEFGYRPPPWYAAFKHGTEALAGDPAQLAASARAAGFTGVRVQTITVRTGVTAPQEIVSWRLGMAHTAPFVQSLDPPARARIRRNALAAVAGCPPLTVPMLVLTSR